MALDLYEELRRVVTALEASGVDYALAGALAVAVHGSPRATADIDLLVRPGDAEAVAALVEGLGFTLRGGPIRFPDGMVLWRRTRVEQGQHLTVDLLLVDDNLQDAWDSRHTVSIEGAALTVVSRDALIRMKVASGRAQDLADAQRLEDDDR